MIESHEPRSGGRLPLAGAYAVAMVCTVGLAGMVFTGHPLPSFSGWTQYPPEVLVVGTPWLVGWGFYRAKVEGNPAYSHGRIWLFAYLFAFAAAWAEHSRHPRPVQWFPALLFAFVPVLFWHAYTNEWADGEGRQKTGAGDEC